MRYLEAKTKAVIRLDDKDWQEMDRCQLKLLNSRPTTFSIKYGPYYIELMQLED